MLLKVQEGLHPQTESLPNKIMASSFQRPHIPVGNQQPERLQCQRYCNGGLQLVCLSWCMLCSFFVKRLPPCFASSFIYLL
jgi:hypothetical protein